MLVGSKCSKQRETHMEFQKLKQLIPLDNSKFFTIAGEESLVGGGSGQEEVWNVILEARGQFLRVKKPSTSFLNYLNLQDSSGFPLFVNFCHSLDKLNAFI